MRKYALCNTRKKLPNSTTVEYVVQYQTFTGNMSIQAISFKICSPETYKAINLFTYASHY